jgi:hypothetical protein
MNGERVALKGCDLTDTEVVQKARDRLTRSADQLGDHFVREAALDFEFAGLWIRVFAPAYEELRKSRAGRTLQADGGEFLAESGVLQAQFLGQLKCQIAVLRHEPDQILPLDEANGARLNDFGGNFLRFV